MDFFEETKDRRGLVLSGLTNEMLGFLSAVMDHGSPSDVFVAALIAETAATGVAPAMSYLPSRRE